MKRVSYGIGHATSVFLSAMFKTLFEYFMIFFVEDVIVYSKTKQDHITYLQKNI